MTELVLHEACAIGDYESLEADLKTGKYDPNCRDEEWGGKSPLHWACIRGSIECTRLLLSIGVNGNIEMDNGWTPAHCAAESGRIHILRTLHNGGVQLNQKDVAGDTPMDIAIMYNQKDCAVFLQGVYDDYLNSDSECSTRPTTPKAKKKK